MQENHLFEYAVIRVVPRVEREEFINVGVVLYCAKQKFLKALISLDESRLEVFKADLDCDVLKANLIAFERICAGEKDSGPIGKLDAASRFRWLTATRSTVVQASKVHPGFCKDAMETLNKLHEQLVLL
jgi:hypothetical protein|nr:DUF3037 domain-containing protein [Pedobacter panaciterrae]